MGVAVIQTENINERFIKLHCIGCPYASQERITGGLPGCSSEKPDHVVKDIDHKWGCSSRWMRDYDWGAGHAKLA